MNNICNVLVLGSGSREQALAWKLGQSPMVGKIYCAPGNAGGQGESVPLNLKDYAGLAEFCLMQKVGLVVVGSEELLADGISDFLRARGLLVFGPSADAARIESDKAYAAALCEAAFIPMPRSMVFDALDALLQHLAHCPVPIVLKDSFLALGKGVLVTSDREEAKIFAQKIFAKNIPMQTVVVQDYLVGQEVSAFVLCDGERLCYLGDAQDYKRIGDGDTGANSGGVGSISPAPALDSDMREEIMECFARPLLRALSARGVVYRGVIFLGLIMTQDGLRLLEFNARFGDPETQALLPRLNCDLLGLMLGTAKGCLLSDEAVTVMDTKTVCVVMTAKGYPGDYVRGSKIEIASDDRALIFHANTEALEGASFIANGGRTLSIVAQGSTLEEARNKAYATIERSIVWPMGYYRKDIGLI